MLVLGIDPGTAITGYGFVEENDRGELRSVTHGVIETPADMPMEDRLQMLYDELTKLILLHRPQSGAVEKLFFRRNVTTAISVGQARGVILLAMVQNGVQYERIYPDADQTGCDRLGRGAETAGSGNGARLAGTGKNTQAG